MTRQVLPCTTQSESPATRVIFGVRPTDLGEFTRQLPGEQARFLIGSGFSAVVNETVLLPGPEGVTAAVVGLGTDRSYRPFGVLPYRLPVGAWRLAEGDFSLPDAVLGFCLGAYRYSALKTAPRAPATLVVPPGQDRALSEAAAIWFGRDLINRPANLLSPSDLAAATVELAREFGAQDSVTEGAALAASYPTVAAVGAGSDRAPVVAAFTWAGSRAEADAPLVSLCGKGVVFDSGGYDLKPSAGMLRMKKDMGGAASLLTLARIVMAADLPLRLSVRIGCVENAVSGHAMRPLDVIRTRRGLTVEIGNTDAEGRLVLCDLLAEASDENPALLVDCATLTGSARVALGPDLPALFSNDDGWAEDLLAAGQAVTDPTWRLPLWDEYNPWLDSKVADLGNVAGKTHAGAVVAALFLQRFVKAGTPWIHLDTYAWNESERPGRPEGGEVMAMRALARAIETRLT